MFAGLHLKALNAQHIMALLRRIISPLSSLSPPSQAANITGTATRQQHATPAMQSCHGDGVESKLQSKERAGERGVKDSSVTMATDDDNDGCNHTRDASFVNAIQENGATSSNSQKSSTATPTQSSSTLDPSESECKPDHDVASQQSSSAEKTLGEEDGRARRKDKPPVAPDPETCCESGCVNCVWIKYAEEVKEYYPDDKESKERLKEILDMIEDYNVKMFVRMELGIK